LQEAFDPGGMPPIVKDNLQPFNSGSARNGKHVFISSSPGSYSVGLLNKDRWPEFFALTDLPAIFRIEDFLLQGVYNQWL
jgi:hypothetical protein